MFSKYLRLGPSSAIDIILIATVRPYAMGRIWRPCSNGLLDWSTDFLRSQKILADMIPLSRGLANQDAAMLARAIHLTYDINTA